MEEKKPNWIKVFVVDLLTEPFRDLKDDFFAIFKSLNRPRVWETLFAWLFVICLIPPIYAKASYLALIFGISALVAHIWKEWKSGKYRERYNEKRKNEQ